MSKEKSFNVSSGGKVNPQSSLEIPTNKSSSGFKNFADVINKKPSTIKQIGDSKTGEGVTTSGLSSPCPTENNVVRLMGTDSSGRFLEVPQIVPIYVQNDNDILPFSIQLNDPDEKAINFLIPRGTRRMVIVGWYAIPCYIAESGEVADGYRRLVVINPDEQHELGWDVMGGGPVPPAPPYTFRPGMQAGCMLRYGWDVGNYPIGAYHHAHHNYHIRLFPVPLELPAGAQGKLTIQRAPNEDKWFPFFPEQPVYVFVGLIGRRVMEVPPPFNIKASQEPTSLRAYGASRIRVPMTQQIGQLGRSVEERIRLTDIYPSAMDELILSGELDGLFVKANWYNGMMSLDWIPAMLFQFKKAGGRNISPIFVEGNTEIEFVFSDGVRLATQADEVERFVSIDLAGGIFGW
jgi:hypothetical protein